MSLQPDMFSSKGGILLGFINADHWPLTFVHMPVVLFLNSSDDGSRHAPEAEFLSSPGSRLFPQL